MEVLIKKHNSGKFAPGKPSPRKGVIKQPILAFDKIGRWTIESYAGFRTRERKTPRGVNSEIDVLHLWNCICSCGTKKTVLHATLSTGHTKSCGCLQKEAAHALRLPDNLSPKRKIFSRYQKQAAERGFSFDLSFEEFIPLVSQDCFYCGLPPVNSTPVWGSSKGFPYNGVDRLDSTKGYSLENIVPCCGPCNVAKNNLGKDEFLAMIKRIYLKHFSE